VPNMFSSWFTPEKILELIKQVDGAGSGLDSDLIDGEHVVDIVTNARVKAHFPDTISNILSDHNKANHDALGIDADTVDGEHAGDIVTNTRVKVHFPDTIANILSDHNKANHDALNIDADTVDGEHAGDIVTNTRVKAFFPDTISNILSDHNKANHDALNIDADTVDGEHAANIVTNARVKAHFPDTIANILSDHNKANHDALNIDAKTLEGYSASELLNYLTPNVCHLEPATGTARYPERINDGDDGSRAIFDSVGEYVEIIFLGMYYVSEYRYNGYTSFNGDGRLKIQHWDGSQWVDNTLNIPTVGTGWTNWISLTTPVVTSKIRIVATALDSYSDENYIAEFELRGRI